MSDDMRVSGALAPAPTGALAQMPPDASLNAVIARAISDPSMDVARLGQLFDLQQRIVADQRRIAFDTAMSAAQQEMEPVYRDAENSHTRSRYARLETIDAAIRPIYTRHGFSLSFDHQETEAGVLAMTCRVAHSAGHVEIFHARASLDDAGAKGVSNKTQVQAFGSTMTYLRRYTICMVFNIVLTNEDNDGNAQALGRVISEQQRATLSGLIDATSSNVDALCKYAGVTSLDEITVSVYPRVLKALETKLNQMEATREAD